MRDEDAVREVLDRFKDAVERKEIKTIEQLIAPGNDVIFYGSQAGDKQIGQDAVVRSFAEQFKEVEVIKSELLASRV